MPKSGSRIRVALVSASVPHARRLRRIKEEHIRGDMWSGARDQLPEAAGQIVKQVADLVWIAAGPETGCWLIDDQGRLRASEGR